MDYIEGAIFNREAEVAVVGALFLEGELIKDCTLKPAHFYQTAHQIIFEAMREVDGKGIPVDLVSVVEQLGNKIDNVGGITYMSDLAGSVPTTANFNYYCKIVLHHAKLRKGLLIANKLKSDITHNKELTAVGDAIQDLTQLDDDGVEDDIELKDLLVEVYEEMGVDKGDLTGIDTGFEALNYMTAGLQNQDLIIVGARPSMGKTAFCLNVGRNAAGKGKAAVGIFSLEMGKKQLVRRMISAEGNIDASKMRNPRRYFNDDDWTKTTHALGAINDLPLQIYDKPGVDMQYIWSKARKFRRKHMDKPVLIIIDYLQLIVGNSKHGGNRQAEISEISRLLKTMARELDITVIALSQLSRAVEQRQDKRPMMSDLRESGQIEQDADIIAFLYRDDYYNQESEAKNIVEIILAKQRNGPVGKVELAFVKEYNKFVNLDNRGG